MEKKKIDYIAVEETKIEYVPVETKQISHVPVETIVKEVSSFVTFKHAFTLHAHLLFAPLFICLEWFIMLSFMPRICSDGFDMTLLFLSPKSVFSSPHLFTVFSSLVPFNVSCRCFMCPKTNCLSSSVLVLLHILTCPLPLLLPTLPPLILPPLPFSSFFFRFLP